MAALRGAALGLLLATGCGDPLVDGRYGGESRLLLRGKVDDAQPPLELPVDVVRAGLFWHPRGAAPYGAFTELVEQPGNGRNLRFPGGFHWELFEEPEAVDGFALGTPLLYLDADQDRRWDPEERLIAGSPTSAVLFAPSPLPAERSPIGRAVPAGFSLVMRTWACSPRPEPVADGACGVPLGQPCEVDADCGGGGVCLVREPWPWPGGYCAIPEPPADGCRPRGAALFRDHRNPLRAWWVQPCQAQAECGRGFPYQCELTRGACLPSAHVLMLGAEVVSPRPFCLEDLP